MTLAEFTFAALGLLMTPGPTNTLLAVAGSEAGWRRALRLIPWEMAAYLAVTLPLALAGAQLTGAAPWLRPVISAAAGAWVLVLALRLWWPAAGGQAGGQIGPQRVFVTTLLNPKALIFGLVLLPGAGTDGALWLRAAVFAGLIAAVAAVWAGIGSCTAGRADCPARQTAPLIRRLAAVWLAVLALGLLLNAAQAAI